MQKNQAPSHDGERPIFKSSVWWKFKGDLSRAMKVMGVKSLKRRQS